MSRNRYDREDDREFYGGSSRGGWGSDDRYGPERANYTRGSGALDRDFGYDDSYGARSSRATGAGRYYGRDDYGRGNSNERADYRHTGGRNEERGRGASRSHVRCRDIMTRDVTVATRETSLLDVAAMMRDENTGVIPVVEHTGAQIEGNGGNGGDKRARDNGKLVGLITDRDIVIRAIAEGKDSRTVRAEEVMTTDVYTAQPNDRVIDAIRKMGDKQVRRIPVVDDKGNLRGIISMADVALETEDDRELADALEEISSGSSFWSKIFG